jgi:hypothetical protein
MVKVFITVDTEVWPNFPDWPHTPLPADHAGARDIDWYLHGGRSTAARGVPYQLEVLARAGLKATYFVDPMFSFALGLEPLRDVVSSIVGAGQEVGLHLHPEWLTDPRCRGLPRFAGPLLNGYGEADQCALIHAGLDRVAEAGAPTVSVFRAGSWGANRATLRALRANGIHFDSSLNARFAVSFPDIDGAVRDAATQPFPLEGVSEFPMTTFADRWPSGRRPLHVCAASLAEFRLVLEHAASQDWQAVVIAMHSFEFVRVNRIGYPGNPSPQRLLARRFEQICAYLAENRSRFRTCHFRDESPTFAYRENHPTVPRSSLVRTAMRHVEQLASRFV